MERRATLRDVAERAGVTTATVSYILNDKKSFPDETRQRVMNAIAELGYIPNLSARTLTQRSSKLIGIVVPQTEGSRLIGIISHVGELREKIDKKILVVKEKSGGSRAKIQA